MLGYSLRIKRAFLHTCEIQRKCIMFKRNELKVVRRGWSLSVSSQNEVVLILNTKLIFETSLDSPDNHSHFILPILLRLDYLKKKLISFEPFLIVQLIWFLVIYQQPGCAVTCNSVSLITSALLSLTINLRLGLLSPVRVVVQAGINYLIRYLVQADGRQSKFRQFKRCTCGREGKM